MKKSNLLIAILLILSLVILLLSFIDKKKELEISNYAKDYNFNENHLLAVAVLNSVSEANSKYIKINNMKVFQTSSEEIYLIIPRYKEMNINIYEIKEEEKTKINSTSMPFVITGNSNILLEIDYDDKKVEYTPSLNEDKKIEKNKYILNITK